jgi:hypothetical protein
MRKQIMKSYPTGILAFLAALGAVTCAVPASAADDSTLGTWQKHEYTMHFMGFTTTYSCDGLEEKMRELLLWAGARRDVKSSSSGCDRGFGLPSKFATANVSFYTLAVAPAGSAGAVAAAWRKIQWQPHRPQQLGEGDCELVEQFRDQVLPMFTTRALENRTHCAPHEVNPGDLDLGFEVLVPAESSAVPAKSP